VNLGGSGIIAPIKGLLKLCLLVLFEIFHQMVRAKYQHGDDAKHFIFHDNKELQK
jgi:hypothetical protein